MLHLWHPALVHVTVAFLTVGALVEAWGLLGRAPAAENFGGTLVLIGTASLAPTLFSGYLAANTVTFDPAAAALLAAHERNGWFVLAAFGLLLFWKGWVRGQLPPRQRPLFAVALLLAAALTLWSALLGGEMVYGHGVGVAPGAR